MTAMHVIENHAKRVRHPSASLDCPYGLQHGILPVHP